MSPLRLMLYRARAAATRRKRTQAHITSVWRVHWEYSFEFSFGVPSNLDAFQQPCDLFACEISDLRILYFVPEEVKVGVAKSGHLGRNGGRCRPVHIDIISKICEIPRVNNILPVFTDHAY